MSDRCAVPCGKDWIVGDQALMQRVASIKNNLALCAADPRNKVTIQSVPASALNQLANTPGFPPDMLLLLREIGEMLEWSVGNCAAMEWWTPCDIDHVKTRKQWTYDVRKANFSNGENLLFLGWDCDGKVYFYDTSARPWALVASDGLMVALLNQDEANTEEGSNLNQTVVPWAEERDVLFIIESWTSWAKSCSRKD